MLLFNEAGEQSERELTSQINKTELNISTERLIIRFFDLDDAPFILEMLNDPDFIRFVRDSGVRSVQDARTYLSNGPLQSYQVNGFGLSCVCLKENKIPIGMCGILKRDNLEDADIGFGFLPKHRGQGYALESSRAIITHAQKTLGVRRILAIVDPSNMRSVALLEKLGFAFERLDGDIAADIELAVYALTYQNT